MFPSDSITWVQTYVYFDAADNKEFIYTGDKDTIQGNECHIVSYPIENIKYFIHEDLENGKT